MSSGVRALHYSALTGAQEVGGEGFQEVTYTEINETGEIHAYWGLAHALKLHTNVRSFQIVADSE